MFLLGSKNIAVPNFKKIGFLVNACTGNRQIEFFAFIILVWISMYIYISDTFRKPKIFVSVNLLYYLRRGLFVSDCILRYLSLHPNYYNRYNQSTSLIGLNKYLIILCIYSFTQLILFILFVLYKQIQISDYEVSRRHARLQMREMRARDDLDDASVFQTFEAINPLGKDKQIGGHNFL